MKLKINRWALMPHAAARIFERKITVEELADLIGAPEDMIRHGAETHFDQIIPPIGVETKSYEKDGFVFLEDGKGRIIEIQILNLSRLAQKVKHTA